MTNFIDGLVQFFTPMHLLAVIALGLLARERVKRVRAILLAAFGLGLAAGSVVIAAAVRETPAALVLLAIAAIAGVIVVVALPLPRFVNYLLAFATGTALALNAPPQAISIPSAIATQIGTAVAALALLSFVTFAATKAEHPWQRIGIRVLGSWIAASAILVLALRLAR